MQINGEIVQDIRIETLEAIRAIAEKYGLSVEQQKSITYTNDKFGIRFEFSDNNVDLDKVEFEKACHIFGLQSRHYGAHFIHDGEDCVITGLSVRAKKYPVKYLKGGKPFKASALFVKDLLREQGKL
jgi:hypothetical protein